MEEANALKIKTAYGLFWSFLNLVANQGIQFILQIILARILLPEDFGLIGMITVFIAVSQSIVDSGFSNALIREKNNSQEDYSTVFYFNLIMASILYIVLFFIAPSIGSFFGEYKLKNIIRVLGLVIIINSFGLIQRTMLIKNINFKTQTKINLISSISSGISAIMFAYLGFGVWSLVIQTLMLQFTQSILLSVSNKWVPSLVFSIDSFKRLFGFGWKILLSGLINTLYNNLYFLIIGKSFSTIELGYYTNAQKLRDMASQSITTSVQKVSYPVLSSIKEENELRIFYIKIIKILVFITFPLMIGLAMIADPLIKFIFGQKWIKSIFYFQILCFAGMLFPLHAINLSILQVKGRSDLFLRLEIIKKIIGLILVTIVLYYKLDIIWLLWIAFLNSCIGYYINSYYSADMLSYSTIQQIKDLIPSFSASILMAIIIYISNGILPNINIIKLIIQIIIGIISYVLISKIMKIEELDIVYNLLSLALKKANIKKNN